MGSYLDHLEKASNARTFDRKLAYIEHNLREFLPQHETGATLEIGPGIGELVAYINRMNIGAVDVVDNDKTVLTYVKTHFAVRSVFLTDDISAITKKMGMYDAIVLIQVLEHIPPEAYKRVLTTLYAHLNPGGHIAIVVPNGGNPLGLVERYGDLQHYNAFTESSLRDLVTLAGLPVHNVQVRGYCIPPSSPLNLVRIAIQKVLHVFLLGLLIANGGTFFTTLTPNIMLIITKSKTSNV